MKDLRVPLRSSRVSEARSVDYVHTAADLIRDCVSDMIGRDVIDGNIRCQAVNLGSLSFFLFVLAFSVTLLPQRDEDSFINQLVSEPVVELDTKQEIDEAVNKSRFARTCLARHH